MNDSEKMRAWVRPFEQAMLDAKPVQMEFRGIDLGTIEKLVELMRLLYQEVGGDDLMFEFRDQAGRLVANPTENGVIVARPYDDAPR